MLSEIVTVPGLKYTVTFLTVKEKVQKTVFHLIASFHRNTRISSVGFYWIQIEANVCQNENCKIEWCCALLFASGEKFCHHWDYWELRQKACKIWVTAVFKVIWMNCPSSTKVLSIVWVLLAAEVADSIVTFCLTFLRKWETLGRCKSLALYS